MNTATKQQIQTLWADKTSFEELQTHQIFIDEPLIPEKDDEPSLMYKEVNVAPHINVRIANSCCIST